MPYSKPHYAVIKDGEVVARHESFMLTLEAFTSAMRENDFLELSIQNTRAIKILADTLIDQSKTKVLGGFA